MRIELRLELLLDRRGAEALIQEVELVEDQEVQRERQAVGILETALGEPARRPANALSWRYAAARTVTWSTNFLLVAAGIARAARCRVVRLGRWSSRVRQDRRRASRWGPGWK